MNSSSRRLITQKRKERDWRKEGKKEKLQKGRKKERERKTKRLNEGVKVSRKVRKSKRDYMPKETFYDQFRNHGEDNFFLKVFLCPETTLKQGKLCVYPYIWLNLKTSLTPEYRHKFWKVSRCISMFWGEHSFIPEKLKEIKNQSMATESVFFPRIISYSFYDFYLSLFSNNTDRKKRMRLNTSRKDHIFITGFGKCFTYFGENWRVRLSCHLGSFCLLFLRLKPVDLQQTNREINLTLRFLLNCICPAVVQFIQERSNNSTKYRAGTFANSSFSELIHRWRGIIF